jgi:hypothetical protein
MRSIVHFEANLLLHFHVYIALAVSSCLLKTCHAFDVSSSRVLISYT